MSDEETQPQILTGHARRLANLRPFQKGNTFGAKGRTKDLARFGNILMGEFYKKVPVQLAGKVVNKMQGDVLALQMMKAAINGTMSDRRLLLQFIEAHEAREAKREEARLKKQANGTDEIDWDVEREETYQRLLEATAKSVQLPALTIEGTTNGSQEELPQTR